MKIAGIVAEYNPFHNGHAHQIAVLRTMGYDAVVCVCSPSVVQRGTAALLPTPVRTRAALLGGADVVLSLPAPYATLSAEGFAQASVYLLAALGVCNTLAFGAETPDTNALVQAARVLRSDAFSRALPAFLTNGAPFPAARAAAADSLSPGLGALLRTPNNILGVEYCKALLSWEAAATPCGQAANDWCVPHGLHIPQPIALSREGAQHDTPLAHGVSAAYSVSSAHAAPLLCDVHTGQNQIAQSLTANAAYGDCSASASPRAFASATALRTLFLQQNAAALAPFVPAACLTLYREAEASGLVANPAAFSIAVLSRLRALDAVDFSAVRGANEGLNHRLAAAVRSSSSLEALYEAVKTKRYAHARVRRLVLDAALGYTPSLPATPPYLHVLGASETGLAVLKAAKIAAFLPLSQSLAKLAAHSPAARAAAQAHASAEDLTALCLRAPQPQGEAFAQKFITLP